MFPLIGAAPWLLARRTSAPWRWAAGLGGFLFAVFSTSLDVLAGTAAGTVQLTGHPEAKSALYAIAACSDPSARSGWRSAEPRRRSA